ncbi:MAG TPA: flagellar M-ring protein FliF C-terminal domain-containing protein [Thermoclostridium caenicola]|uniref:Flagellar M-ring protein FliF n=1 Tax=Thermoclostridium caenicola TaxID=659425 RepID=A0A1M6FXS6_9FIRM|nr:flagellar M-ring protein FliF C-terminal domain-containing protein [Thermoclostridium caenicola]SHJ02505.1 flagellar M-ring protein FliF [Thermoclostridium caenicola]HOK42041.1 flagellar M-ring protein FliF C-terminal domain-containing protein [Thermoclostridium caenicola]HOL85671.1 flagellar M-ring protein FliF C-terminal domain-containing protein [Thermoclostridium caenicola]HPO75832.1 flagellar M-ring protein FliF C-terminal domain-containing protein [Thermoclostridium caenicola]
MPEGIKKIKEKAQTYWKELEKSQKIRIYVMVSIVLLAVIATLVMTLRVEYVPLFDSTEYINLKPVVEYLDENNIKYQKGSNQIYVDSRKKKDIEFDLTTQGIVSPEVSFADTWSKLSLTATEADKENLWKNYLVNDLVYKLKKFDNVENATVQYTRPEKTYWARDNGEDQGSAYVMLKTTSALTPDQVDAAAKVVAASLGVPADRVTIVDHNLNPLTRQGANDLVRASTQDEMRRQRQLELEQKVYETFKIGVVQNANFDTMSVSANPTLDFDTHKSVSREYSAPDPDGQGFRNNYEMLEENLTNGNAGSIPGTDTNPQTAPTYQFGENERSDYRKVQSYEERLFNETNSETEKALGKLIPNESTMSIVLWYGKVVETAEGLTPEYLNEVRKLAADATGIPAQNITVSIQKLMPEPMPVETLSDTFRELFDQYGLYVLMLILLVIMVVTALPRKKSDMEELELAAAEVAAGAGAIEETIPDISVEEQSELKKQIDKFVQQNPDAVAQLLRNWIAEDWE